MTDQMKQRHGCLTAWLILMIIGNSLMALIYLFQSDTIRQQVPNAPGWFCPVMGLVGVVNLICAVALFKWKKWGFFGFAGTSAIVFALNLMVGLSVIQALFGLLGLAILYGVLQIGKEKKGWPQLE
jgi:hypothetical protein